MFFLIFDTNYSLLLNDIVYDHSIICFGDSLTHGFYISTNNTSLGNIEYYPYALSLRKHFNVNHTEILEYGSKLFANI